MIRVRIRDLDFQIVKPKAWEAGIFLAVLGALIWGFWIVKLYFAG